MILDVSDSSVVRELGSVATLDRADDVALCGHFAYVADRDHARTEDGMAGVVISTDRLIYHSPLRHRETRAGAPLEVECGETGQAEVLSIVCPSWTLKRMKADRDGLTQCRRGLSMSKLNPVWK
jgi:hypothetical protein